MRLSNNSDDDKKPEVIHADHVTPDNSSVDAEKANISNVYVKTDAEKRYVRKVGWTFLPLVTWIVMVQVTSFDLLHLTAHTTCINICCH